MKKVIIFLMIIGFSLKSYSQEKVDTIFKILLILDNAITDSNENPDIQSLLTNIDLKAKEIENSIFKPTFFYDYKIYKFNVINDSIIIKNNSSTLSVFGECSEYIIIFNEESQRYYRIKGFKQNDFSLLLNDIILYNDEKIPVREVVKKLNQMKIKELDFNCMYQYLKDSPKNRWKYPCMSICTDGKSSHLTK